MANRFFITKQQRVDIPLFRAYVVSVGCIVDDAHCSGDVQPNHFILVAQGGSDVECGGLCDFHHREFHRLQFVAFCAKYNILWDECRTRLLEGFFLQMEIGLPFLITAKPKTRARGRNIAPLSKKVGLSGL